MTTTETRLPTQTIVVADDDPDLLELLTFALSSQGYNVHGAPDGNAAMEMHVQLQPSLMILDWNMPGMTGVEVCRQIREELHDVETPVLIYSAMGPDFAGEALGAGATEYHTKPTKMATFVVRAAKYLGLSTPL